jgi:hypothetical protein
MADANVEAAAVEQFYCEPLRCKLMRGACVKRYERANSDRRMDAVRRLEVLQPCIDCNVGEAHASGLPTPPFEAKAPAIDVLAPPPPKNFGEQDCRCGCGTVFKRTTGNHGFLNRRHQKRYQRAVYREQRKKRDLARLIRLLRELPPHEVLKRVGFRVHVVDAFEVEPGAPPIELLRVIGLA